MSISFLRILLYPILIITYLRKPVILVFWALPYFSKHNGLPTFYLLNNMVTDELSL